MQSPGRSVLMLSCCVRPCRLSSVPAAAEPHHTKACPGHQSAAGHHQTEPSQFYHSLPLIPVRSPQTHTRTQTQTLRGGELGASAHLQQGYISFLNTFPYIYYLNIIHKDIIEYLWHISVFELHN